MTCHEMSVNPLIVDKMAEKAQIYNQNASVKWLEEMTCNEMTVDKMPQRSFQFC